MVATSAKNQDLRALTRDGMVDGQQYYRSDERHKCHGTQNGRALLPQSWKGLVFRLTLLRFSLAQIGLFI